MLYNLSKSIFVVFLFTLIFSFGRFSPTTKEKVVGELISHVQVKQHPSNKHLTVVRFALHYDARVSVFVQKRGSSALISLKKTAELKKGVKTLQIDQIRYPSKDYQLIIKAGKNSKVVDYSL